jgi:hypothetical protein
VLFAALHESAIGPKRHAELHRTCPLLGVKRTSTRDGVLISDSQIFLEVGELNLTFRTKGNFKRTSATRPFSLNF